MIFVERDIKVANREKSGLNEGSRPIVLAQIVNIEF
jgi:hypothetical protein